MTLHIPAAFEKRLRIRPAGTTSKNCGAEALSTFRPRNATSFHLHEKCPPWRRTLGIFCFWSLLHHVLESSRANLCHLSPMQRKKIVKLPWNHLTRPRRKKAEWCFVMSFSLFRWDVPLQHSWALAAVTLLTLAHACWEHSAQCTAICHRHKLQASLAAWMSKKGNLSSWYRRTKHWTTGIPYVTRPFHRFLLTKFTIRLKTTALVTPMTSTPRTMPRSEEITFPTKGWGKVHSYYLR